jgi:hypothetical protein
MTPAQRNAKKAMKLYHSGEASSLKEAWSMVRSNPHCMSNPRKRKNKGRKRNPVMRKNSYVSLGVRKIRSRYGVAGMIDGRMISTGGVFKSKRQAERAIYYTESALYDGTKGRKFYYDEGRRYGYSAVDKFSDAKKMRLMDTVMADLTRNGARELIDMLTKANQAGLASKKSNPRKRKNSAPKDKETLKLTNTQLNALNRVLSVRQSPANRFPTRVIQAITTHNTIYLSKSQAKSIYKALNNIKMNSFLVEPRDRKSIDAVLNKLNKIAATSNPRKRRNGYDSDETAIREVLLTVTNDGTFYEMVLKPFAKNMAIKQYKGRFNKTSALKGYKTAADRADKFYAFNYGTRSQGARHWMDQKGYMLSANDRRKLAAELLEDSMEMIEGYVDDLKSGVKQRSLKNPRRKR